MAKFKINAGAEIDVLTPAELEATLRGWMAEVTRGVKFIQTVAQIVKPGATFLYGPNSLQPGSGGIGPEPGFLWSIMRVAVSGTGIAAADTFTVYNADATPSRAASIGSVGSKSYQKGELVLQGGTNLWVSGGSAGAGTEIFISVGAIEVPAPLAWQLC